MSRNFLAPSGGGVWAGLAAQEGRLAEAAVARASAGLAARIAAEAPEVRVETGISVGNAEIRLVAPGLVPRVFGSRRRGPDPRLLAVVGGGR